MNLHRFRSALFAWLLLAASPLMAAEQSSFVMPNAGPMSMATFVATYLNPALRALASCHWGTSAPANGPSSAAIAYQCWADTTSNPVLIKRYDGAQWVVEGALDTTAHTWTPYRQGAAIAAVATSSSAADLTTGTLPAARLPNPSASTLGGTQSKTCSSSNWLSSISTSGVPGCSQPSFADLTGSIACSQLPAITGDVTRSAGSCASTLANIPSATPAAGSLLATNVVAPATPAAGKTSIYVDSTDKRLHDKNDAGTVATTSVPSTCSSSNWFRTLSSAGVLGCSQPSFSDLSSSLACSQTPALTGDVTTSAGSCATTIANSAVSNAKMASMAAYTLKGNATGFTAAPTDIDVTALALKASPGASDIVLIQDVSASNAYKRTTVGALGGGGSGVSSVNTETGALVQWPSPQGRITLTSNTPVMAASVTAATTIYYTASAAGKNVPIYNGSAVVVRQLCAAGTAGACELSVALGSNWAASSNYDWFIGLDSGTLRLCSGPDWSAGAVAGSNAIGASVRGAGAGSTEIEKIDGLPTNKNSMACRYNNTTTFTCAAHQCTHVGTTRTGSAGQVSFTYGASGTAGTFNLWNAFNQEYLCSTSNDPASGGIYSYSSSTTRQADASAVNQFNFVTGAAGSSLDAIYYVTPRSSTLGAQYNFGIALNSTNTIDAGSNQLFPGTTNFNMSVTVSDVFKGVLGANFISANEQGDGTNPITIITIGNTHLQRLKVCGFW